MKPPIISLAILLFFLIFFPQIYGQSKFGSETAIINDISLDSLKKHLTVLSHDSLEGRGTGTDGERKAASYISQQLKKYAIFPGGDNNTYFQNIPMHGSIPLPDSRLRLYHSEDHTIDFELGDDYLLLKSGAQTYVPKPVDLVFAGYGIIAPEFDYNDYHNVDVHGKVIVCLPGEPQSDDPEYFQGAKSTIYSLSESKQRIALSRGALGSIIISSIPDDTINTWEKLKNEYSFEDVTLAYSATGLLSILMHPGAATRLFDNCAHSLQDVLRRAERHELQSFPLNLSLSFKGEFIERDFTAKNVIGIIKGTEVAKEQSALLISAHYDHLGVGPVVLGDSIYNGLIDNAAGVAAALEIGRNLAINQNKFRRSVILLFTTGEEKGLLGARYYADHPLMPLHQTIANINIDGLAMFDIFYDVVGIGAELSNLQIFLENALSKLSFKYVSTPQIIEDSESFSRSDQFAFANGGIPSMLIMEGFQWKHYNPDQAIQKFQSWMDHIYHSPFDDINQPINYFAALTHVQIILSTAEYILQHDETPIWKPSVKFHNIRLQTIAERK